MQPSHALFREASRSLPTGTPRSIIRNATTDGSSISVPQIGLGRHNLDRAGHISAADLPANPRISAADTNCVSNGELLGVLLEESTRSFEGTGDVGLQPDGLL